MKRVLLGLLMLFCCLGFTLQAQTNLAPPTVSQLVATNANQIMIEILTGVKNETGQIYQTSKAAIGQAYETVKKETPEVIREFMAWKMVYHGIWLSVFLALASIAFYWSRRFRKMAAECPERVREACSYGYYVWNDHGKQAFTVIRYALLGVTMAFLFLGGVTNIFTMAQLYVAPRVYIIEYVVDTIQSAHPQRR